jgi:predicted restriction endonuclease
MGKPRSNPSESDWHALISGFRDGWGNQRDVVHRPLLTLLLLARAQRGESNQVRFNDLDGDFWDAIRELAPSPKPSGLEYPFWHLQKHGFWRIEHPEILPRVKNKDRPTRRGLVKYNPKGYVPEALWDELTRDPRLVVDLACRIIDEFWPDRPRTTVASALGLVVEERTGWVR